MKGDVTVLNDLKQIFDEDDFDFVFNDAAVVGVKRTLNLRGCCLSKIDRRGKEKRCRDPGNVCENVLGKGVQFSRYAMETIRIEAKDDAVKSKRVTKVVNDGIRMGEVGIGILGQEWVRGW